MKFSLYIIIIITINVSAIAQLPQLEVEGNAKIKGNLDISHMNDSSSIFLGRNARITYLNDLERRNTIVGVHSTINPQSGDNAGLNNSIVGFDAGKFNRGSHNVFMGAMSGQNNRGFSNSFYGYSSGIENTFGASNSFFGYRSGYLIAPRDLKTVSLDIKRARVIKMEIPIPFLVLMPVRKIQPDHTTPFSALVLTN